MGLPEIIIDSFKEVTEGTLACLMAYSKIKWHGCSLIHFQISRSLLRYSMLNVFDSIVLLTVVMTTYLYI